ncbi:MAG TPA: PhnD/SsuA/transferrin family substrate-binding protein [Chloroflexota bacterium]
MTVTTSPSDLAEFQASVQNVVDTVVAPSAARVDAQAEFPRQGIGALARVGALGILSATDVGGSARGLRAAAATIESLAKACGSTAMVVLMHYAAVPLIEAHGPRETREAIGAGRHLTTLAFSEAGSRSHFWAPLSTAKPVDGHVRLDAQKSWVTSAGQADSYVWSSQPLAAPAGMTLWLVPAQTAGLSQSGSFDGLGLRGNASMPIAASDAQIAQSAMLGQDGAGLDVALGLVLPNFLVLNAAFSLGLMEATATETAAHLNGTRLEHLDQTLAQQQTVRLDFARLRLDVDSTRAFLEDTLGALESGRPDAMLRVLEVKALASEASLRVTDLAMKLCGGAAFRKELGIERHFRDWFLRHDFPFDYLLYSHYERQVEELLGGHIQAAWNSPLAWVRARRLAQARGASVRALAMRDTDQDLTSVVVVRGDSPVQTAAELGGKVVGVGAVDSPQATLLPLALLRGAGVEVTVRRFDVGVGLHGDHIGGEREAARALIAGQVDAACMIDGNHLLFSREGTLPSAATRVIAQTQPFDHCNMTIGPGVDAATAERFRQLLLGMSYSDPDLRQLFDLEGLTSWRDGRTSGYAPLESAVDTFDFYARDGEVHARDYRP